MELHTRIIIPPLSIPVSYSDRIVLFGSCFAGNIGGKLEENRFCAEVNPFGVLYNPVSVAQAVRRLMRPERFTEEDLFEHEGLFHSFAHHGSFSAASPAAALETMNGRLAHSAETFRKATRIVITFGTAYVYRLKDGGQTVANCHKLPERLFSRERLTAGEIAGEWRELLDALQEQMPQAKVLLTVSPIRHWKDGAHGNQLSKASLLLATEELREAFPERVDYFPAYELMMDELRDYRFYADDMLHPSPLATEYIWERFAEACFTEETKAVLRDWNEIAKAVRHKPFHSGSEADCRFVRQTLSKMEQLQKKAPSLNMEAERERLYKRLTVNEIGLHDR
ncbi:GSCFA family protein [Bacteroidales bacterium Barb6]|nr:GSCFA family protein [Bacteroidales bacterium Barb6]OAV73643.1 GSCFA family protein [Bacteroidales bacterium Barb6]